MKPMKFHKLTPFLPVNDLRETLDFYQDHFGFHDPWTMGDIDGGIRRDDLRLLFSEDPEHVQAINNDTHRLPLIWFVENVDAVYDEFRQRQIPIVAPIEDMPWGIREFSIRDNNGYLIRISETISMTDQNAEH